MSDYLKHKVQETQTRLDAVLREAAILEGQLQAYKDALAHGQSQTSQANDFEFVVPGVIRAKRIPAAAPSKQSPAHAYWKTLFADMTRDQNRFTIDDVVGELRRVGKKLERKSIRAKLTDLVKVGYLIRIQDGVFKVAPRGVSGDELRASGIIPPHSKLVGEDA